jgi:hypothetical protein
MLYIYENQLVDIVREKSCSNLVTGLVTNPELLDLRGTIGLITKNDSYQELLDNNANVLSDVTFPFFRIPTSLLASQTKFEIGKADPDINE